MPDYSKSIIYRIYCKDENITGEYIGSIVNKYDRKKSHKSYCNNENSPHHNYKLYIFIRANGGFDNFIFETLEEYSCENKFQLEQRERYWIELRKPSLNHNTPTRTKQEYDYIYNRSEQRKKYNKKYRQCEQQKEYRRNYNQSKKRKEYDQSEKRKEYLREYHKKYITKI